MALFHFLSLTLVFLFSQAPLQPTDFTRGEFVIYTNQDGESRYMAVGTINGNDGPMYLSRREHNGAGWTQGSIRVTPDQLTRPVASLPHRMQNRDHTLRKGMIVLGANRRMYIIEDVFADGRVAVTQVSINANSRHRFNGNFLRNERQGFSIINRSEITAVETNCFLRLLRNYCKGQTYTEIENIPICHREVLATHNPTPSVRAFIESGGSCGKFGRFTIHALFSDGTIAIFNNLLNPFPRSLHEYHTTPPPAQEGEAMSEAQN